MSVKPIPSVIGIAELAIGRQPETLLMPVSTCRQSNEVPGKLWIKISILI